MAIDGLMDIVNIYIDLVKYIVLLKSKILTQFENLVF